MLFSLLYLPALVHLLIETGGPRNIIPGAVMFALFGAGGQAIYNAADTRNATAPKNESKQSWMGSKWSPLKVLSDKEYEEILQEKLLSVNAEIALVDESIAALRVQEQEEAAKSKVDETAPKKA